MCTTDTSEAEEVTLERPLSGRRFLNPVSCDSKITICVASLPGITCQVHLAFDVGTLDKNENQHAVKKRSVITFSRAFNFVR